MLSLLRARVSLCLKSMASSSPTNNSFSKPIMDASSGGPNCFGGSQRLMALAQQLRMYKPPSIPGDENDDAEQKKSPRKCWKSCFPGGFCRIYNPSCSTAQRFRPKWAAVSICLVEGDSGEFRVILTKRSSKLSTHSGEVALPEGKAEESDANDAETSMREAKEEIGLDPSLVNVVTSLEPSLSKDENLRSEEKEWMDDKYLIHFFDYEMNGKMYLIWGLTAGILIRAASVVYQRPPAFLEQNPKFKVPRVVNADTVMR